MKRWLILWISLTSILEFTPGKLYACASGPEPEDYRFAAFLPFMHYRPAFATFNFCYRLYNDAQNRAGVAADRERNIDEWIGYIKSDISRAAIYDILYATSPSDFEAAVSGGKIKTVKNLAANPFFQWLTRPEHREVKEYMRFAKYSEILSSLSDDPWEEDMIEDLKLETFIPNWRVVAGRVKDPFLLTRFNFQFLRLHFYFKDFDSTIAEYERTFDHNVTPSVIKPWAEEYYAAALSDTVLANYHFAQSFANCDDKKLISVMYFDRDAVDATLELAKSDRERFNILAIWATNNPERHLETLTKLYRLDPKNELLEMLTAREINKCEDWLLTPVLTGEAPAVRAMPDMGDWSNYAKALAEAIAKTTREDLAYAKQLASFLNKVATEDKVKNRPYWLLATAYANFVAGDYSEARSMLSKYNVSKSNDFEETSQVLDLMLRAQARQFDASFERDFMRTDAVLRPKEQLDPRHHLADQLTLYIAHQYGAAGDLVRSAFVTSLIGGYWWMNDIGGIVESGIKSKDVAPFLTMLTKSDKSPFEKFITRNYQKDSASYYGLLSTLGSIHLREYHFKEAYDVFNLVPDSVWNDREGWARAYFQYLNQNPFVARPGSNHVTKAADSVTYSKKTFSARMMELERLLAGPPPPNRDEILRQYADAHFAMTYYGNSWLLVASGWSSTEVESYSIQSIQQNLSQENLNYYGCRAARMLYETLMNSTRNTEIKAHCAMMISRCDKNYTYLTSKDPGNFKYKGDKYLNRFLTDFKKTRTYKAALAECPTRKSFVYWAKQVVE